MARNSMLAVAYYKARGSLREFDRKTKFHHLKNLLSSSARPKATQQTLPASFTAAVPHEKKHVISLTLILLPELVL